MNKFFLLLVFMLQFSFLFSQEKREVVADLVFNSSLFQIPIQKALVSDLSLPFFDDFSTYKGYPNSSLWEDNDVFINRSLPVNPLNLGVATFDGLDSLGNPRNIFSQTVHGPSDFLTSKSIDVSEHDLLYFSFCFQSTGLGNIPESNDSLLVQFLDINGQWNTVWYTEGKELSEFEKVDIIIEDSEYLFDEFQFRFHNYSTLSGNFDHWHLDNVLLTEDFNLSQNTDDVAFVYETSDVLNFYTNVPWSHFVGNESSYIATTMDSWLRNNYSIVKSIDYRYDIFNEDGNIIYHYPTTGPSRNDNVFSYDGSNYSYSEHSIAPITLFTFAFSSTESDNVTFDIVQSIATDDIDLFKNNDTLRVKQEFKNFYSLDDGTAEASYGINVEGGMMGIRYNISEEDILKAVQIHFEQSLEPSNSSAFSITIWSESSGMPDEMIYQSQIFYPEYTNTQNGFFEYVLENPISIEGSIFVGMQQYYDQILNVGLDKNTVNNDRMYYNLGSGWLQSNCAECSGTWMIRPVFGALSNQNNLHKKNITVYPNPSNGLINVNSIEKVSYKLYDLKGRELLSSNKKDSLFSLDVSFLPKGIYLLKLYSDTSFINQKVIVQ